MAQQDQDQDRTEQPTQYKREQARKRGAVAKSMDVVAFAVLAAALLHLTLSAPGAARSVALLSQRLLAGAGGLDLDEAAAVRLVRMLIAALGSELMPVLCVAAVVATLATLLQVGAVVSFQPLKPDLKRLNPVEGLKRLFTVRVLIEAAKTLVKAGLLVAVVAAAVWGALPRLFFAGAGTVPSYWERVGREVVALGWWLLGVLLLVALADWVLVRWELTRRLRMSRRELRDELRHREGDPRIRQRQRQLRLEALKRIKGLGRVQQADVLVTNPTHYAVALQYDRDKGCAPVVVAKGAGELAAALRQAARRHGVPVFQNPKLARALFRQAPIDAGVPLALFPEVARVLVWAYRAREAQGGRP